MCNVFGTWRCVCEQDTAHIHVIIAPNNVLELAIYNLHLLPRAVPAGMGILKPQPTQREGVEVVEEQCAWYVEVCVCEQDTAHIHAKIASTHVLELTIYNLLLLPRAVPAGMGILELQPTHTRDVEVVDEKCAWYVEVCVGARYGTYPRDGSGQSYSGACHMQPAPPAPCCASWHGHSRASSNQSEEKVWRLWMCNVKCAGYVEVCV